MNKNFLIPSLLLLASGILLFVGQGTDTQTRADFEQGLTEINQQRAGELLRFYKGEVSSIRELA